MTWLTEQVKTIAVSLVLSAIMVTGSSVIQGEKQAILLEQNMKTTEKLTNTVEHLMIDQAVSRERFVTWEQLRAEIHRLQRGNTNGS